MDQQYIYYLLEQQKNRQLTTAEQGELRALLSGNESESLVQSIMDHLIVEEKRSENLDKDIQDASYHRVIGVDKLTAGTDDILPIAKDITGSIDLPVRRGHILRKWGWAAASIIMLSISVYLWTNKRSDLAPVITGSSEIPPGKVGAILMIADGSQVSLDTIQNGVIAMQGGTIAKVVNGILFYEGIGDEVLYNTMSTPNGRQFHLTLPDGTKVWLNAASSIQYPTSFIGNERKVFVTGEVYFEVAQNAKQPFRVNINNKVKEEILVLGTSFNVKGYGDESIKTTLIEGAVKINGMVLRPGEAYRNGAITASDVEQDVAWKNGLFNFEGATLGEIMKQLERWYDIEVAYEKGIPNIELTGKMSRGVTLNDLLIVLERLGVHARLEGRKLIVMP